MVNLEQTSLRIVFSSPSVIVFLRIKCNFHYLTDLNERYWEWGLVQEIPKRQTQGFSKKGRERLKDPSYKETKPFHSVQLLPPSVSNTRKSLCVWENINYTSLSPQSTGEGFSMAHSP